MWFFSFNSYWSQYRWLIGNSQDKTCRGNWYSNPILHTNESVTTKIKLFEGMKSTGMEMLMVERNSQSRGTFMAVMGSNRRISSTQTNFKASSLILNESEGYNIFNRLKVCILFIEFAWKFVAIVSKFLY